MSQTEGEMWASLAEKTAENGQVVSSTPIGPADANAIFDRGWDDLGFLGVGSGHYRGSATGLALAIQCADVKARDLSKAEMLLWKRRGARGWEMVEPTVGTLSYHLMTKPNDTAMTWPEFWRMTVLHLELAQNAYVYTPRDREGTILEFIPIMPGRCRMRISDTGRIFYEIVAVTQYDRAILGGTYIVVPETDIIHLRGRLFDGISGMSNLVLGTPIFDLLSAIGDFQTKLFGNDGRQPLVFEKKDGFPNSDQGNAAFRRLKEQLREAARRASNMGEAILLEEGMTAKTIAINAQQAESTSSFTQQAMRVCGLMDVPPHRLSLLESVAYNNLSAMNRQYVNDSLMPLAKNIEVKFRNHSLPQREWPSLATQFDRSELMSNDPETVEKLLKTGVGLALISVDEGREILPFRLNPVKNGGDRFVPVNMAIIRDGEIVSQAAEGQNPTNVPAGAEESDDNNADKGLRLVSSNGAA
jgi:HK97 family phage portal protein